MSRKHFSRRDFLKVMLTSLGAFLAACMPKAKETETSTTDTPPTEPPLTQHPETEAPPEPTEPPATEVPATEAPVVEEPACLKLLSPENDATLDAVGKVVFSWEPMEGAAKYQIEFTLPTGQPVTFEAVATSHTRYLESFPLSGDFFWNVTALDANGSVVCSSDSFSFTKLASEQKQDDGSGTEFNGSWSIGGNH